MGSSAPVDADMALAGSPASASAGASAASGSVGPGPEFARSVEDMVDPVPMSPAAGADIASL